MYKSNNNNNHNNSDDNGDSNNEDIVDRRIQAHGLWMGDENFPILPE